MSIRRAIPLEIQECFTFVHWLKLKKISHYHIFAGGKISPIEASKLSRLGVGGGWPDFCVPVPKKGYHGLYLEMKRRKGGVISPDQREKLNELNENGYLAVVSYGCDEAIKICEDYLGC